MSTETFNLVGLRIHNRVMSAGTLKNPVAVRTVEVRNISHRLVPNAEALKAPAAEICKRGNRAPYTAKDKVINFMPESFHTKGDQSVWLIGKAYGCDGHLHQYETGPLTAAVLANRRKVKKIMPANGSSVPGTSCSALGVMNCKPG